MRCEGKKGENYENADWTRTYNRLQKDIVDEFELLKKRIHEDPYSALFGRRLLHPYRSSLWGSSIQTESHNVSPSESRSSGGQQKEPGPARNDGLRPGGESSGEAYDSSSAESGIGKEDTIQEFDIDPITMRKIPKKPATDAKPKFSIQNSDEIIKIPVKRFGLHRSESQGLGPCGIPGSFAQEVKPTETSNVKVKGPSSEAVEWLAQEGFGTPKQNNSILNPNSATHSARQTSKIESALDRKIRADSASETKSSTTSRTWFRAKETEVEDVDLLRASDIRAASGLGGKSAKWPEKEKQDTRSKLVESFERMAQSHDKMGEILANLRKRKEESKRRKQIEAKDAHHAKEVEDQKAAMQAMEMYHVRVPTSDDSATAPHTEPGEGDMASNVHEFVGRERWYKRRAPHATSMDELKAIRTAKDRSLVCEIRAIYEESYGTIDTNHRQLAEDPSLRGQEQPDVKLEAKAPMLAETCQTDVATLKSSGVTGADQVKTLETQEKIGTMVEQLLDDSNHLFRLLRTYEMSPKLREELFYRNRNIVNALEAIVEVLPQSSKILKPKSLNEIDQYKTLSTSTPQQEEPKPQHLHDENKGCVSSFYNVLAYDPSVQQVTTAEIVSAGENSSDRRLSLSEALSSLTEPAKFLPLLHSLQKQGYEIVSSDTNVLVLKKANKTTPLPTEGEQAATEKGIQGEGTSTEKRMQTSNTKTYSSEPDQSSSGSIVRRNEDVFSGSLRHRWQDQNPIVPGNRMKRKSSYRRATRRRRTVKRMLWLSLWTAGCCYAVGAITEFLRA